MLEKNLDTPALPSVLIVDDRPENLEAVESVLSELKIKLVKAGSGEEALRAVLQQEFAAILLDVQMPGMDGFETAALIRQRERSAHTPIIFLTAIERSEERAFQGYQSGAVDYIFKPFNPEILRAKVSVFVDLWAMRHALAESEARLRHINATLEEMVTQRTHELVKSEAKYRQLVENIHEIFMMGKVAEDFTQGALTFISPQVESILGIHPDNFLKNPGMWVRLVHPEDSAEFADCTRRALSKEQLVTRTYRQKNARTGQYRWLEDTLLPQFDEGRRVIGYYGVVRDITERKQAEVALSARNQELAVLNSVAIELASIQTNCDLYTFIVSRIKQITGAASATFGLYDSQKQEIHVEHAELDQNLATNLMQALGGRKLTEAGFPVSDEVRLDLIQNPVKIRATLSEITFGVVSPLVGKIAQTAQGIDRFVGIAYVVDGELFGATVLGLRIGQPDPSLEMLQAFASMVAVSLKRKRAEDALRRAEQNYRNIFENSLNGIFQSTPEGRYTMVNPAMARILGYDSPEDLLASVADTARQIYVNPDHRTEHTRLLKEQGGSVAGFEYQAYRKDGGKVWVSENVRSVVDADHNLLYYEGIVEDISVRKRAEEAVRASEERYRLISSVASDYMFSTMVGADGRLALNWVAGNFEAITGYTLEEFTARGGWRATLHPDDLAVDDRDMETLRANQSIVSELRTIKKNGELAWIRVYAQPLWDAERGELAGIYGAVQDITEKKQIETVLAKSEKNYRMLFENMPVGLYRTTPDGHMADANAALVKMFGFQDREALLAVKAEDLYVDPADNAKFLEAIRQSDIVSNFETEMRRRDGTTFWTSDHIKINRDDQGNILSFEGSLIDITERKRAEEQARRHVEQMAIAGDVGRALAETLDLNEIYERLYRAVIQLLPDSDSLFISLFDPAQNVFRCAFAMSEGERLDAAALPPAPLEPPGKGTQSEAYHTRRPVIINDLVARLSQARMVVNVGEPERVTRSGLYVPMMAKDQFIGALITQSLMPNRYTEDDASLASLVANTAAVAIENARLYEETRRRLNNIEALRAIDHAISGSLDLRLTLGIILKQVVSQLNVDAAATLLLNPHTQTLEYAAGCGFRGKGIERSRLRLGEGHAGRAALERKTIKVADLREDEVNFTRAPLLAGEEFIAYFGAPLIAKGQVKGVLEVYLRTQPAVDDEWLEFLETLTGQVAIAVDSSGLFTDLQHANAKLFNAYDATIEGWSHALDLRDKETEGHTLRVTEMTLKLARAAGVTEAELAHVRRGALLHDIGKMGVPDSILLKPGQLTAEEWVVMRKHPTFAFELLSPIAYLRPALDIPYCHHEKWDGSGYPRGLKGEQIPLVARLFAVVDVYDALTSDRPYRPAWKKKKTLEHIRTGAGSHFDPMAVDAFIKMMESETR